MKLFPPLLAILSRGLGLLLATASAQEDLHCMLIDVPLDNMFLVREEMKLASPPSPGKEQPLFSTNGNSRDVIFRGNVSTLGKQRVELGRGGKGKSPAERGRNEFGLTITVEKLPGEPAAHHRYDVAMLLKETSGDYFRFQTASQTLPVQANRWQEVASWTHGNRNVMLWQYVAMKTPPPPAVDRSDESRALGPGPNGTYLLDVVFGRLSEELAVEVETYTRNHARSTVETLLGYASHWKCFGLNCRPGLPFVSQSARGEQARIAEPAYDESCLATLRGTVTLRDSGLVNLAAQLHAAIDPGGETKPISFGGDVNPGEWKIQTIADGPRIPWQMPAFPNRTAKSRLGFATVNVVAFRVLKVAD